MFTFVLGAGAGYTSITSLHFPPANSWINWAACSNTSTVPSIATPFSKRVAASVLKPWCTDVFLICTFSNSALSKNKFVVLAFTPELSPPNTPAIHNGFCVSLIIKSFAVNVLSTPSSVVNLVPAGYFLTRMVLSFISAASKAWSGCPVSCKI